MRPSAARFRMPAGCSPPTPLAASALSLLGKAGGRLRALGVTAIGVFGSVARGDDLPASDIDVIAVCSRFTAADTIRSRVVAALRPLNRAVDVNFPENLCLGSALWANCARDARMVFGVLPVASPRKIPIRMDSSDGIRVLEEMVHRWPRLGAALEQRRLAPGDSIGTLACRLLAACGGQGGEFIRHYDATAMDVLGRDCDWIGPAPAGADPRKRRPSPDEADGPEPAGPQGLQDRVQSP